MRIRSWRVYVVALAVAMAVFLAACGGGGNSGHEGMNMNDTATSAQGAADRTVDVNMVDIGFEPKELTVKKGETVKFVFHNMGKIAHEALFGDQGMQDEHEKDMSSGTTMHDASMKEVQPGQAQTVNYTFDTAGTTIIGCHEQGHYAAGMKITVTVQ